MQKSIFLEKEGHLRLKTYPAKFLINLSAKRIVNVSLLKAYLNMHVTKFIPDFEKSENDVSVSTRAN